MGEGAVERRKQPRALVDGNHHRTTVDRARRLVAAGVVGQVGAGVIDPQDVGDDRRVHHARSVARNEHRRATIHRRPRTVPDTLTGQRRCEHRLDRRGRVTRLAGLLDERRCCVEPDASKALEPRTALARGAVGVVLRGVDHPVPERHVISHPLGGALSEGHARRFEHVTRIGDPEVQQHEHQAAHRPEDDPPAANHPPMLLSSSSPRDQLATA